MVALNIDPLLTADIMRPGRYLGNERGAVHKPWESSTVRWALSYPELYELGASNTGHIILYSILNSQPRQLCDRVYMPAADLIAQLKTHNLPLFALESRRPLREFDIIGFSLSYELGGTNVLEMLTLAGIPLTWAERDVDPQAPLIFAGGPTATSNPEPFAEFFDFFALGDGEEVLPEIGLIVEEGKAAGLSRQELLYDLAQVPGVYVPRFYAGVPPKPTVPGLPERIMRRVAQPMPHYALGPVPYIETIHDRLSVEVRRGCTRGCRFCQPGMLTRPARDLAPDDVVTAVVEGLKHTGYDEFSLTSLSCSDYLSLAAVGTEIKNQLPTDTINLSLPSQRVDRFDTDIAAIMGGSRPTSLTFAPEAGTQRMRDIINKGLTTAELLRGVKTATDAGWDKVKLYFMIGLPGETDADVIGIAETLALLLRECKPSSRRKLRLTVTISNFTPKPHTPFQWFRVDYAEIVRKQELLKREFRKLRGVRGNFSDVRFGVLEDLIGKGDRRLSRMIYAAWSAGAGMDSWWENIDAAYAAWLRAYQVSQDATVTELPTTTYGFDDPLPWDHIDTGISKQWLKEDWERAMAAATVPDCSFESCSHCGICGTDFGHNIVLKPVPVPELAPSPAPADTVQRWRLVFAKQGSMRLLGHLDLMRLWERACRRAQLPLAYTGGFHPSPRLAVAAALPLGFTSQAEVLDLELYEDLSATELQEQLAAQLPSELPIYALKEIPLKAISANAALQAAQYRLSVEGDLSWAVAVERVLKAESLPLEKTTKSGRVETFDARARLLDLQLVSVAENRAELTYTGMLRNDGTYLRPEQVVQLLAVGESVQLLAVERLQLQLNEGL